MNKRQAYNKRKWQKFLIESKKRRIEFCRKNDIDESFAELSTSRAFNFLCRAGIKNKGDAIRFFRANTFEMIKSKGYPLSLNYGVVADSEIRSYLHD